MRIIHRRQSTVLLLVLAASSLILALTQNSLAEAGFLDIFKKKEDTSDNNEQKEPATNNHHYSLDMRTKPVHGGLGEVLAGMARTEDTSSDAETNELINDLNSLKNNLPRKRPDLAKIRAAAAEQNRLAHGDNSHQSGPHEQAHDDDDGQKNIGQKADGSQASGFWSSKHQIVEGSHEGGDDDEEAPSGPAMRFEEEEVRAKLVRARDSEQDMMVCTNQHSCDPRASERVANKLELKHTKRPRPRVKPTLLANEQTDTTAPVASKSSSGKSKFLSSAFIKKKMQNALKVTKHHVVKPIGGVLTDIPKYVNQATDSISALLKLDSRGKLLAMIDEVNANIHYTKKEFSVFTIEWAPIMEKGLNYLGIDNLNKLKWNKNDELDFRRDALYLLAYGYEFIRLLIIWRDNLLSAHEAMKYHLKSLLKKLKSKNEEDRIDEIDEDDLYDLNLKYTYILTTAWLTIEEVQTEPKEKLLHLNTIIDSLPKNYESEYFRKLVTFQEMFEPTIEAFTNERTAVEDAIAAPGALGTNFDDVDEYFTNFRDSLSKHEITGVEWEVPKALMDFLNELAPQVQYNQIIYSKAFLRDLREAVERAQRGESL